jgi:hypothetical protein
MKMVGLIQKLFMDMIQALGGDAAVAEIKKKAGLPLDTVFQINEVYPDDEWQRLLAAGLKVLNITPEQADEYYADYFGKDSVKRFPTWFEMCKNSYEFLLIQPTIHNCFATGVADQKSRDVINDKFVVDKLPNKIITHYRSPNGHCGLYKALARWMIRYYKDEAIIDEKQCMKSGGKECEIHIEYPKMGA